MKTLDEAIDYAQMIVPMTDAPDTKDMWTSIEHYLEIYRELSKMWNDRLDKENQNDPLTLDELRAMGGKPVWVEKKHSNLYHMWGLVAPICEDCFLNSAIHHLKMFQKVIAIPEGESGEITVTVRKKSHRQTYKQFLEDMKVLGYDEISRKEDNDR